MDHRMSWRAGLGRLVGPARSALLLAILTFAAYALARSWEDVKSPSPTWVSSGPWAQPACWRSLRWGSSWRGAGRSTDSGRRASRPARERQSS